MKRLLAVTAWGVMALGCSRNEELYADEIREREAFAKRLLDEADAGRALNVSSTSEIQFEEGFSILSYELDPNDGHASFRNHAFRWMGQNAHVRLKSHGPRPMKLFIQGWMHHKVVGTQPVIKLFIDGVYIKTSDPIPPHGHYKIEAHVPEWAIRRPWVDLTIRTTAIGFHWGDPPELKVLNVYKFSWTEDG
jgi:hypothetical protein